MFLTTYIKCKLKYSYATSKFIGFIITLVITNFSIGRIGLPYLIYMYEYLNILRVKQFVELLFGRFINLTLFSFNISNFISTFQYLSKFRFFSQ